MQINDSYWNHKIVYKLLVSSKVGDHSRVRPEGSFFFSYYTEV